MTAKDLRNYKNLARVINMMKKRVVELSENTTRDSVRGSNPVYPYEERTFSVVGAENPTVYDRRLREAEEQLEYFEEIKRKIDNGREKVKDPVDKLILEYTLQGKTQQYTADVVGFEQATVSIRLKKIINLIEN